MSIFDEILAKHVTDEADRQVFRKYGELVSEMDKIATRDVNNQNWLRTRYDSESGKTFREKELEEALVAATERAAAAGGNTEMTFEQIEASLKAKGYVSAPDLDTKISAAKSEMVSSLNQRDLGSMVFTGHVANLARKHNEEFGVDLDVNGFAKHIVESGAKDPISAYDQFVASKRTEKQAKELETLKASHAAELEKARTEAAEAGRKAALMESAPGGMPVDQGRGSGSTPLGWMQKRILDQRLAQDENGNQVVPGGRLGDNSATAAILAQVAKDRAEGKLTVQ